MADALTWLMAHWQDLLAVFGGVVIAISGVVAALQKLVDKLEELAARTTTDADDEALQRVGGWLDVAAAGLDWIKRIIRPLSLRGKGRR